MRVAGPSAGSWREGAFCGAVAAAAAAAEMLALNRRTINPVSGAVLAGLWLAAGAGAGAMLGALGGRAWAVFRARPADGAGFLATITVGHLLLPLGAGPAMALVALGARPLRRRWAPRLSRLDHGVVLAAALLVAEAILPSESTLPPRLPSPIAPGISAPVPGAVPVTVTVHPPSPFPEVAAVHSPLRPLVSEEPGLHAALLTGRLPARTGAGPSRPRAVPGGGGVARIPARRASRLLAAFFPIVERLDGTPFAPAGTLPDLVRAAGLPVLEAAPAPGDPPLFLRWRELEAAPDLDEAERLRAEGAWIDVTLDPSGAGSLALSGAGTALRRPADRASLVDVAPTALHLLGLAVPRECDGRVLLECLARPGPGARQPRYRALASGAGAVEAPRASPTSEATTSR